MANTTPNVSTMKGRVRFRWRMRDGHFASQWLSVPIGEEEHVAESLRNFYDYAQREALGMTTEDDTDG